MDRVAAQTDEAAEPVIPGRRVLDVQRGFGFIDEVVAAGLQRHARLRVEQGNVDEVVPHLHAGFGCRGQAEQQMVPAPGEASALDVARIALVELVAMHGIVLEVGEVRPQLQPVVFGVEPRLQITVAVVVVPLSGNDRARGASAVARIERAKAAQRAGFDQVLRHLIGGIPVRVVAETLDRPAAIGIAAACAQQAVDLAHVVGILPRPVFAHDFERRQQIRSARIRRRYGERQRKRRCDQRAKIVVAARAEVQQGLVQGVPVHDVGGPGRGEIAAVGEVRSLVVVDALHEFGDQEVDVAIALAVGIGRHVDRDAVDARCEVGAVIEVETAQEVLIGLALAGVLGDDHARNRLEHFAGTQDRNVLQQCAEDHSLRGGVGRADAVVVVSDDIDDRQSAGADTSGAVRQLRWQSAGVGVRERAWPERGQQQCG